MNRAALRTVLERRGFVVDELDGDYVPAAFSSVPVPPDLAIVSVQTVLLDFGAVCAALRHANPDVYIAALLENERVHEASSVFDAGANDFLVSSPLIQKLDARLSVICAQLYHDVVPATSGDGVGDLTPRETSGPRRAADPSVYDYAPVPHVMEQVVRRLGLDSPVDCPYAECGGATALSGWFAVLVQRGFGARWINLRIDVDRVSLESLFRAIMHRRPSAVADLRVLMNQFLGLIRDGLDSETAQEEAYRLHFPVLPQVFSPRSDENGPIATRARTEQRGFCLNGNIFIRLTASLERSRTVERAITQLRPLDVLAMPIESGGERTLLREGIMLDEAYISRIQRFAFLGEILPKVHVFRPPGDTALFLTRK